MRIAVLSRSTSFYCTRRLLERGRDLGHEMVFLPVLEGRLTIHGGGTEYHQSAERVEGVDAVIPRIGSYFPTFALAQLRALEGVGTSSLNSSSAIEQARDKVRTLLALARAGLPVPRTAVVKDLEQVRGVLSGFPTDSFVIKPFIGAQGRGVMLAESQEAAASILEGLIYLDQEVLVQEFLPRARHGDRRLIVLGGRVIGSILRRPPAHDFRTNLHRGGTGEPVETTEQERNLALEAARAVGLEFAGVDLIERAAGEPVVLEVNPSPGWEGLEQVVGLDVAAEAISALSSRVEDERRAHGTGVGEGRLVGDTEGDR